MHRSPWTTTTFLCAWLTAATTALAGPDWEEGSKDAGASAGSAQTVSGTTSAPLTRVRGSTSSAALVGEPDLVDMFLVRTGSNPQALSIALPMGGTFPIWPARLTIFQKVTHYCAGMQATYAQPIATVRYLNPQVMYPVLAGGVTLSNPSAGATLLADLLLPNTEYYIAVSAFNNYPTGDKFSCVAQASHTFFSGADGYGIYQVEAGYEDGILLGWTNPTPAFTGGYQLITNNVFPLPATNCGAPFPVPSGLPATVDFDFAFGSSSQLESVECAAIWPVYQQFYLEWTPTCSGLAEISTCGLTAVDTAIEVFEICSCSPDSCMASLGVPIACGDQGCSLSNATVMNFPVEAGVTYLVRLCRLGWGNNYTGSVKFSCEAAQQSADLNGDGVVNSMDLAILLGRWGGPQ